MFFVLVQTVSSTMYLFCGCRCNPCLLFGEYLICLFLNILCLISVRVTKVEMIKTIIIAILFTCGATSRQVVKTLTASGSNGWGDWGEDQFCPEGTYVNGFRLKVNAINDTKRH